ncbi:hypothetical protein GH5_05799 [Leishmania sp. Ghana 2012 LV757]|uniref:hypothetical protein n=1 Tax=Leishmania sp. Ghana 2012 LV757 TaxID=2803181 RepID=UPI001B6D8A7F|nr:hypothetical protein GH5_05799 [Leishmania sp. Ghana 2012 LV757]
MPLHPSSLSRAHLPPLLSQPLRRGRWGGSGSSWLLRQLPLHRWGETCGEVQRRTFATRCMRFSPSSPVSPPSSPSLLSLAMQAKDVVTRLGPSKRLSRLRGVFLTKRVKKFHPIEVLPTAAYTAASTTTAAAPDRGTGEPGASRILGPASVTQAPPLVLNLAFASQHTISLRRFLALRHMFSTSAYLHVATESGWYLIAPSSAAPLCTDVTGLQAWCCRHHHRYFQHTADTARAVTSSSARLSGAPHRSTHTEIAKLEAALDSGDELSEEQLQRLAAQEKTSFGQTTKGDEEDRDGELDETDDIAAVDEPHHPSGQEAAALTGKTPGGRSAGASASAFRLPRRQLKMSPPLIPEDHLFEINDGVAWPLPPSDDLTNHEYWKNHRQRMALYESTGDADATEQREALLASLRADLEIAQRLPSEQELHAAAEALFQALKHKANVALNVDAATGLLTLVPLRDLDAGEELLLHYGREWWTGRLLSSLLLAVSDAEMPQIRWIEQLFDHAVDTNEPFPLLIAAYEQRKRPRRGATGRKMARKGLTSEPLGNGGERPPQSALFAALSPPHREFAAPFPATASAAELPVCQRELGRVVLYNTVTRKRATDAAVLAFTVRRSCVDQSFLNRLLIGDAAGGAEPVFRLSDPDREVPMRVLRRVLLESLRGETASAQSSVSHKDEGVHLLPGSAMADTTEATAEQDAPTCMSASAGSDSDAEENAVFSI